MKTYSYRAFLTLSLFFISFLSFADPLDPPADGDPPPTPINSKLIWLGVLGILFAFLYFKNQKNLRLQKEQTSI